jgi:hypothetical protein
LHRDLKRGEPKPFFTTHRPGGLTMARQMVTSELRGEGESQSVRVLIEVSGLPEDFSALGERTRREIAAGLVGEITRAAEQTFGVILQEVQKEEETITKL